jgi:hypothetical protein
VDGAAEDLVAFGRRYWAVTGVDAYGQVSWTEPSSRIDPAVRQAHLAAGAAIEATVADIACPRCGVSPWRVKNRTDFAGYVRTGTPPGSGCGRCDTNFLAAVAREKDPAVIAR